MRRLFVFLILIIIVTNQMEVYSQSSKVVIAHRGASGYLPEHTMESKAMAYAMNPDFIEQDLVLSKDNVPIVIHDIYLDEVTNVATVFPERLRSDGRFYVIDFNFEELKQLNVLERFKRKDHSVVYPNRFPLNKASFRLHSLQEEIELIQGLNKSTQKNIGIYPEIKDPKFHHESGKDISKIVLNILSEYGYANKDDNCLLQCFDEVELKRIRTVLKSNLYLTQLVEMPSSEQFIGESAKYADAIGVWLNYLILEDENSSQNGSKFVNKAHEVGLKVHVYTLRSDQLLGFKSFEKLLDFTLQEKNVDGVFTDFPDKTVNHLKLVKH